MNNIKSLKKEMFLLKKTDKKGSQVLSYLLDKTQKIAKQANREPSEDDLITAAKRCLKESKQSQEAGMDVSRELEVFSGYVPQTVDEKDLESFIINNFAQGDNMSAIMGGIKKKYGQRVDMKSASKLVRNFLQNV